MSVTKESLLKASKDYESTAKAASDKESTLKGVQMTLKQHSRRPMDFVSMLKTFKNY